MGLKTSKMALTGEKPATCTDRCAFGGLMRGMIRRGLFNPKGIESLSPGLARFRESLPRVTQQSGSATLKGLRHSILSCVRVTQKIIKRRYRPLPSVTVRTRPPAFAPVASPEGPASRETVRYLSAIFGAGLICSVKSVPSVAQIFVSFVCFCSIPVFICSWFLRYLVVQSSQSKMSSCRSFLW
jgi:hypothetical protein